MSAPHARGPLWPLRGHLSLQGPPMGQIGLRATDPLAKPLWRCEE